jgi:TatD DNase family protein
LDEVVKNIPIEDIVLETDAPYLAPTPHRGKRNESSYLPLVASRLSDIFEISEREIARITSENAVQLFRL